MAALGEAGGRVGAPCVFPLTKMSKTAAEEMSVAGDPSKLTLLRSYQRVNGERATVPWLLQEGRGTATNWRVGCRIRF